jgi:hypothetical protein
MGLLALSNRPVFVNGIGRQKRFLTFEIFLAPLITVLSVYYECNASENDAATDCNNEAQVLLIGSQYRRSCDFSMAFLWRGNRWGQGFSYRWSTRPYR